MQSLEIELVVGEELQYLPPDPLAFLSPTGAHLFAVHLSGSGHHQET